MTSPGTRLLTNLDGGSAVLDLDRFVGMRRYTFRFDLVDGPTNRPLGEVRPSRNSSPSLSHDSSRTIVRSLSSLRLNPEDTARVDPLRHRLCPVMLVAGTEFPLGRYVFNDPTYIVGPGGRWSDNSLIDEMFVVDQQMDSAFAANTRVPTSATPAFENVDGTLRRLLETVTFPITVHVDPSPFYSTGSWPAGTQRGTIIKDLALLGDYLPPWFGNDGRMHVIRAFDVLTSVPDFDWDRRNVVVQDSITNVSEVVGAPNRFVVVSNDPGTDELNRPVIPVFGTYDVPAAAPHSVANRGFVVADVQELQVNSATQASALAANIGRRTPAVDRYELATPLDPRHDGMNVVRWEGANWIELAWDAELSAGGQMRHTIQRAYG